MSRDKRVVVGQAGHIAGNQKPGQADVFANQVISDSGPVGVTPDSGYHVTQMVTWYPGVPYKFNSGYQLSKDNANRVT